MQIIALISRPERRRMHKAIQSTSDKGFARRLIARHEGKSIDEAHEFILVVGLTGIPNVESTD